MFSIASSLPLNCYSLLSTFAMIFIPKLLQPFVNCDRLLYPNWYASIGSKMSYKSAYDKYYPSEFLNAFLGDLCLDYRPVLPPLRIILVWHNDFLVNYDESFMILSVFRRYFTVFTFGSLNLNGFYISFSVCFIWPWFF